MLNPIKEIVKWQMDAGNAAKPYNDFLESSFQIEEALEGYEIEYGFTVDIGTPKEMSRTIVRAQGPFIGTDVDRLDKACDAIIFAIGSMTKLGLDHNAITKALNIVNNNELVEVDVTEEELQSQAEVNPTQVEFDPNATSKVFKSKHKLVGDINLDVPFFEDARKCFNQGINIIEDSAGFGYAILREGDVISYIYGPESDSEDEELVCLHCENKELIMNHINRILRADDTVSKKDADVLLKLAHLAKILDGVE